MSDTEIIELLATKGMGWTKRLHEYSHRETWEEVLSGHSTFIDTKKWNPLTDLNAVHKIEARLDSVQVEWYGSYLKEYADSENTDNWNETFFVIRHATPRVCCEALVKVLHESSEEIFASMVAEGL